MLKFHLERDKSEVVLVMCVLTSAGLNISPWMGEGKRKCFLGGEYPLFLSWHKSPLVYSHSAWGLSALQECMTKYCSIFGVFWPYQQPQNVKYKRVWVVVWLQRIFNSLVHVIEGGSVHICEKNSLSKYWRVSVSRQEVSSRNTENEFQHWSPVQNNIGCAHTV